MEKLDLREIRRSGLKKLIADRFNGNQAEFAKAAKRNPTQVNHWISGHRNPNGDTCRDVEAALKLHPGWLDQPHIDGALSLAVVQSTSAVGVATAHGEAVGITLPAALPDIAPAVETIAQAIARMSDAERAALTGKLTSLVHAPDSSVLKKSISESLGSAPGQQPDSATSTTPPRNTGDFFQR